jgi:Nuclease-related domain
VQITNCGRGIHKREVKGIDRFRSSLPNSWYALTNLDLALVMGSAREIDVAIIGERRIFVVDIKDLYGALSQALQRAFARPTSIRGNNPQSLGQC